jgi:predicted nucleic acid-binding protein
MFRHTSSRSEIRGMVKEGLTTLSLTPEIAERAARLRAEHNLRTPDAIQMATALYAGASFFLTNDADLPDLANLKLSVLDSLRE